MLGLVRAAARPHLTASFARAAASVHTLPKLDYAYDVRGIAGVACRRC